MYTKIIPTYMPLAHSSTPRIRLLDDSLPNIEKRIDPSSLKPRIIHCAPPCRLPFFPIWTRHLSARLTQLSCTHLLLASSHRPPASSPISLHHETPTITPSSPSLPISVPISILISTPIATSVSTTLPTSISIPMLNPPTTQKPASTPAPGTPLHSSRFLPPIHSRLVCCLAFRRRCCCRSCCRCLPYVLLVFGEDWYSCS